MVQGQPSGRRGPGRASTLAALWRCAPGPYYQLGTGPTGNHRPTNQPTDLPSAAACSMLRAALPSTCLAAAVAARGPEVLVVNVKREAIVHC